MAARLAQELNEAAASDKPSKVCLHSKWILMLVELCIVYFRIAYSHQERARVDRCALSDTGEAACTVDLFLHPLIQ